MLYCLADVHVCSIDKYLSGSIQPSCCYHMKAVSPHVSTTVFRQVIIHIFERTGRERERERERERGEREREVSAFKCHVMQ